MKLVLLSAAFLVLAGCSTAGYYMDAITGHIQIMEKSRPIDDVINENTSVDLGKKLQNFKKARKFATEELLLPDNDSYKEYADIGRAYAVWNVIAAPKYSVKAKKWCFLFAGCISYRGYFSKQDAEKYASQLKLKGYDVYVAGARAYSTLGWFNDPLLSTMMYKSEAARVGILFHELAHQKIYIDDDSSFNEAFATTIEQEGIKRWFVRNNEPDKLEEYSRYIKRKMEFNYLLEKYREKLKIFYAGNNEEKKLSSGKTRILDNLKLEYRHLKTSWNGYEGYDKWMEQDLNNAHLAIVATYNELVPVFTKIMNKSEDVSAFYKYVTDISQKKIQERKRILGY